MAFGVALVATVALITEEIGVPIFVAFALVTVGGASVMSERKWEGVTIAVGGLVGSAWAASLMA